MSCDVRRAAWTTAFTTLVLAQLFNVFNARSDLQSAFVKLFALDLGHWGVAIALASVVLWFEEAVKAVRRWRALR